MKAVDKGLELISYAAGGIGLAQNSTPAESLKGMNRAANLGLINQQRIAAEQRKHNQEMIGLQEAQLDVYTEGFSQMVDGLGDVSFELSNQSKLMNYQNHLIDAGLNEVSNEVKEVQFVTKVKEVEALDTTEATSNSVTTVQEVLGDMMGDAPACPDCGHITIRNGSCYKCLNCGNSLGCS